ncbi:hypothetical protein PR202_ga11151 [Eleusine coracana subsp. coracana]|uniref:Uncharacterized protein n=1 Tax=Eleusine coracana subsp. coracana TaxID=191504 RepID=A0AAV5C8A3_ELECO|nr:hypothetical protein PR202_ga11151 [Eleusine coracana subsp. coracana]
MNDLLKLLVAFFNSEKENTLSLEGRSVKSGCFVDLKSEPTKGFSSAPGHHETSFAEWWRKTAQRAGKTKRNGLNSLMVLGAWTLWKHHNSCVFEGISPSIQEAKHMFRDEAHLWGLPSEKKLTELYQGRVGSIA